MKKLYAILLAVMLVLSLAVGCAPEEEIPEEQNPITDDAPGDTEPGDMEEPGDNNDTDTDTDTEAPKTP